METEKLKGSLSSISESELSQELNISLSKLRKDREKGIGYTDCREGRATRDRSIDVLHEIKATERNTRQREETEEGQTESRI